MSEALTFPLELRRATDGSHVLTGLAVPYGKVSYRTEHIRGERFAPGAFASAVAAAPKIRLTDSHVPGVLRRPVGVATELRETPEGLLGSFRLYDTPEGRGAYENLVEQTYGGLSVGFRPIKERQSVQDGCREVLKAILYHVSLVDEPAYEDAKVLAVRAADDALQQRLDKLLARDWSELR